MPKAGIIYNDAKPTARRTAYNLEQQLRDHGYEVLIATGVQGLLGYADFKATENHLQVHDLAPPGFDREVEFAIVLGGDGTVLSACRQLAPLSIPMLAINTGHMGFLTETYLNNLDSAFEALITRNYTVEDRATLLVQVMNGSRVCWEAISLNEMVLHKGPLTSMCHFEVRIGDHALVDIAADGVILSTPTGSTAYALSAGGPVITPGVSVFQLIPICPHSLASRALVFADSEPVEIFPAHHEELVMSVDGNAGCHLLPEYRVRVSKSSHNAKFIRLTSTEFFKILREKLGWGLPHIAKPTSVELP